MCYLLWINLYTCSSLLPPPPYRLYMHVCISMSEPVLKYIGHKASKVRWEPVEGIERGTRFVTGSYDDKVRG